MNEFKISFRENGKVHVMELKGYLDAHTAPNLEEAFQKLIKEKKFHIITENTRAFLKAIQEARAT